MTAAPADDPRFTAAVDMLGRTGAKHVQIRYCDEEEPTVWIAAAMWEPGARTVYGDTTDKVWQAAGAMEPWAAMFRLLESVVDGGECTHCGKPTVIDDKPASTELHELETAFCFFRFDPENETFRRMCEGVAA